MSNGKKKSIGPSAGWYQKIFGGPVPSSTAQQWPELQQAWAGREIEMPEETAYTANVRPMNWLERNLLPGAAGVAWPWKTIALNREQVENEARQRGISPTESLADTLVHELTHVGQRQKSGLARNLLQTMGAGSTYLQRPYEQEAFSAEQKRPVRRYDINLPSKKK